MKKPRIRVVTTFSLGKDTVVDNVRVGDMKPHDIAEAYSEMIDALVDELNFLNSIEGFFSRAFEMKIKERMTKIEQALKKAGVQQ